MPRKFDFISPDIVVNEVDLSILPPESTDDGLLVIGQAPKGPAMKLTKIANISDLEAVFGETSTGENAPSDIWRAGNYAQPTYGLYAAKAWLASETSPVTYLRLAGDTTDTDTKAGWNLGGAKASVGDADLCSLAYGLFICPSSSGDPNGLSLTGSLAAIIYTKAAALTLSGTVAQTGSVRVTSSLGTAILSDGNGAAGSFKIDIWTGTGTTPKKSKKFHFDFSQSGHIRDSLNTDPHKLISGQKSSDENYFLGETFETEVYNTTLKVSGGAGQQLGILLPLSSGSAAIDANWIERNRVATPSKTGYFISNYPKGAAYGDFDALNLKKLFRFISLDEGQDFQKNYYVEIVLSGLDLDSSAYSDFTVLIKNIKGFVLEQRTCSLDPDADNFIAKRFGDQHLEYNATKKKFIVKGNYPRNSDYVRVEMHPEYRDVANNSVPFGFYGPYKPKPLVIASGSANSDVVGPGIWAGVCKDSDVFGGHDHASQFAIINGAGLDIKFDWPGYTLTDAASNNGAGYNLEEEVSSLGVKHYRSNVSIDRPIYEVEKSSDYLDLGRDYLETLDPHKSAGGLIPSFVFSLDEVTESAPSSGRYYYKSGSHKDGKAYTAQSNQTARDLIKLGGNNKLRFSTPFFGGFDGVDIQYVDPFTNAQIGSSKTDSYTFAAVNRALEITSDEEACQYDLIAMPGITKAALVRNLAQNTATRGDALAIIDINSGFTGKHENAGTDTLGSITEVETQMNTFRFNNSYAACYYPEVKIRDNGRTAIVPSSIAGIGAIAKSEASTGAPWFAPAGFNRGGISLLGGSNGPVVSSPAETLTKAERDRLYQVNVNPIANFPGEGPVVFGQKTLQRTRSALDRINVRRLLIYLKKRISVVARSVLFDANLNSTWNRFKALAEPILADAKSGFGVAEYKLVLDSSTTTPDLVDRNIMYAQVYIRPAYAIEFIAIDFKITRTGIEF